MKVHTKDRIISLLSDINREGIVSVISYLHHSDYFTTHCHHHHRHDGGLAEHSLDVYQRMRIMKPELPDDSCRIVALLHDICTTHMEGYNVVGSHHHGQRSVDLLDVLGFELHPDERLAISHHMHHVPTSKQDEHTLLWHCLHQCDTLSAQSHNSCR